MVDGGLKEKYEMNDKPKLTPYEEEMLEWLRNSKRLYPTFSGRTRTLNRLVAKGYAEFGNGKNHRDGWRLKSDPK